MARFPNDSIVFLKEWLYENRLNPYPSKTQKIQLAEQTKLTHLQVRNWFLNARRRGLHIKMRANEGMSTNPQANINNALSSEQKKRCTLQTYSASSKVDNSSSGDIYAPTTTKHNGNSIETQPKSDNHNVISSSSANTASIHQINNTHQQPYSFSLLVDAAVQMREYEQMQLGIS